MRCACFVVLLFRCAFIVGQTGIAQLPASGPSIGAFIPENWLPLDTTIGDLNNDQRDDAVLVLQCRDTIPGDTTGLGTDFFFAPPRTLAILFGTAEGYMLALQNDHFILRSNEGGAFFDPFEGVEIKDGTFLIYFYGGSAWRWSHTYKFRYGKVGFELIGAEAVSYHSATGEGEARSFDFLTHSMKLTSGNMTEDEESNKSTEKELPPLPLRTFDTFVRPFTWRIDDDLTL